MSPKEFLNDPVKELRSEKFVSSLSVSVMISFKILFWFLNEITGLWNIQKSKENLTKVHIFVVLTKVIKKLFIAQLHYWQRLQCCLGSLGINDQSHQLPNCSRNPIKVPLAFLSIAMPNRFVSISRYYTIIISIHARDRSKRCIYLGSLGNAQPAS